MSFNAPFTTMSYYSWLFENDAQNSGESTVPGRGSFNAASLDPNLLAASNTPKSDEAAFILENMQNELDISSNIGNIQDSSSFLVDNTTSATLIGENNPADVGSIRALTEETFKSDRPPPSAHSNAQSSVSHNLNNVDFESTTDQSFYSTSRGPDLTYTANTSMSQISTPPGQRSASMCIYPSPDAYTPRHTGKLPIMTNEARDGLMQVISQTRPTKPDGSEIVSSDPLLSLSSLQHYSDLFFTRFNSSYPLIHQATFQSDHVPVYLLMSILLLGATYSDKEAHLVAVCIHDIMRPIIQGSKDFGTRPKLWMLQTILLVECFGKNRAGEKQHDMSHLYHGMLIK